MECRSTPIRTFFDNGDPHGKNQFVSVMATSWAVAALAGFFIEVVVFLWERGRPRPLNPPLMPALWKKSKEFKARTTLTYQVE